MRIQSREQFIPIGVLFLAFAMRVVGLNTRPVWYDEAFSIFLAEQDFSALVRASAADVQPPFYYALLHFWQAVGTQPLVLRWLSVALSILAAAWTFALTRKLFSGRAASFALFFCALAPFQIYHAQELRMYSLFALGGVLYLVGVIDLMQARAQSKVLIVGGAIIALYAHSLAAFTLAAANVYFLWRRDWRAQIRLLQLQAIALVAFLPWLMFIPGQIGNIQRAYWTQPPGIVDGLQMLMTFTAYLPLPPLMLGISLFFTLAIVTLAGIETVRWWRRGTLANLGLIVAVAIFPPASLFIVSLVMRSIFTPRAVIVSSMAYYVLLAVLVARAPRWGRIVMVGVAIIGAFIALPFYYSAWGEWRRAPFAEADQFLAQHCQNGDLILHDNKLSFFPMHYYDRALPQAYLADPPGSANDTLARTTAQAIGLMPVDFTVTQNYARVWFVVFQTALDQAQADGVPHGNLTQFEATMTRRDIYSFGDLRIYLYEAH